MMNIGQKHLSRESQRINTVPDNLRKQKLNRIKDGGVPRVLDLFAGCGGLSLGFQKVGFEIAAAIELDPLAAKSHALNFHKGSGALHEAHAQARDITTLEPKRHLIDIEN